MYGVTIGKAIKPIPKGSRISVENVVHASTDYSVGKRDNNWLVPDVSKFENRTFDCYHRADGKVGTRNYWLVIPLVFCENRNIKVIENALLEKLGYVSERAFSVNVDALIKNYNSGKSPEEMMVVD